jgi:hypothetical protein
MKIIWRALRKFFPCRVNKNDSNSLNQSQLQKLADWKSSHVNVGTGAIGGRYTYCYTPTSIGTILIVKDNVTNTQIDLTEYEEW